MNNRLIQDRLKTDCHASREFLLNTPIVPEYRIQHHRPVETQVQRLKSDFPGMKDDKTFVTDCAQKLKDQELKNQKLKNQANFGAMAIKIDEIEPEATPMDARIEDDGWLCLAGVLDEIATANKGRWGIVYKGILGLFIPGQDESGYNAVAEAIRSGFGHNNQNTISIGIAGYPSNDFPRNRIMDNALKALDHAAVEDRAGGGRESSWEIPVLETVATKGEGMRDVVDKVYAHREYLRTSGGWKIREGKRVRSQLESLLRDELVKRFLKRRADGRFEETVQMVVDRERSPAQAIEELLKGEKL